MEPIAYWSHVILGFAAAAAAIVALAVGKGTRWHRWAGWTYVFGMVVAALTTLAFMPGNFRPLAVIQACTALYGLGMALLALNPQWSWTRLAEWNMFAFLLLIMAGVAVTGTSLALAGRPTALGPLAFFIILTVFAVLDWRYLHAGDVGRLDRYKRHALRMGLVVSETVRAPLLTFANDLSIPFPVIVFGSFLLVPVVYVAFTPGLRLSAIPVRRI